MARRWCPKERVFWPLVEGGRSRASGLSVQGRGAPLLLQVLARPQAVSSPAESARFIAVITGDRRGDFQPLSIRSVISRAGDLVQAQLL